MFTNDYEHAIRKGNKKWCKLSIGWERGKSKEKAEHEAGNYVYDQSQHTEDNSVSADPLILVCSSLNLSHRVIYNN